MSGSWGGVDVRPGVLGERRWCVTPACDRRGRSGWVPEMFVVLSAGLGGRLALRGVSEITPISGVTEEAARRGLGCGD